jgi:hypothetical protein
LKYLFIAVNVYHLNKKSFIPHLNSKSFSGGVRDKIKE